MCSCSRASGGCREACAAPRKRAESQELVSRAGLGLPQDGCMAQGPPVRASPCADPSDRTHQTPQAIPPIEQLLQVISRLSFGFKSCCHPMGHIAFPKREPRAGKTPCTPQAGYLETCSAGLRLRTWAREGARAPCHGAWPWGCQVACPPRAVPACCTGRWVRCWDPQDALEKTSHSRGAREGAL